MTTIAYLANLFPSATEPYVAAEICELRKRGIEVVPCSIRRAVFGLDGELDLWRDETTYLRPLRPILLLQAAWLCLYQFALLNKLLCRVLLQGKESPARRLRALAHTFLGAYFAIVLKKRRIHHIHVHHGYFGSWVAMVAARLLRLPFSMTLHGSDLLVNAAYLDLKLDLCQFCVTVSEFNRRYILDHHPQLDPRKISVQRLGVDCGENLPSAFQEKHDPTSLIMFTAGRLHRVKDQAFLLRACRSLKSRGLKFACLIAGDGPERTSLEQMISSFGLQNEVHLLGQVPREKMHDCYEKADLVVLTSRSEGIPLVLMEAMAHGKAVLAPAITGIPELVSDGETGFLYRPGSLADFVARVELINRTRSALGSLRRAARRHVLDHFNRQENLAAFCDHLIANVSPGSPLKSGDERSFYENPVLQ
jgi:colanic acid/amylovoran biosynthesis glycosyltransferase